MSPCATADWAQVVEQQVLAEEPASGQLAEARLTQALTHPNIVVTHTVVSRKREVGGLLLHQQQPCTLHLHSTHSSDCRPKSHKSGCWPLSCC